MYKQIRNIFLVNITGVLLIASSLAVQSVEHRQLKGRIEKIFVDGKSIIKEELKAQAKRLDLNRLKSKSSTRRVHSQLKTFPAKLRGEWKGALKITKSEHNPQTKYDSNSMEAKITRVGNSAYAKFRFYTPSANKITMDTPIVKLPYPNDKTQFAYLPMFNPSTGAISRPPSGNRNWVSLDQSQTIKAYLLANDVRYLGSEKVEQYLVVKHIYIDKKSKNKEVHISEYIYQFERVGAFQLIVKLAAIDYNENLVWENKLLFEGTVK